VDEEAARELHSRAVVIDSHNDSTVAYIRRGNLGLNGERERGKRSRHAGAVAHLRQYTYPLGEGIQLDIPRLQTGGVDAAFFSVDCTRAWGNHLLYTMDAIGYLTRQIEENGDAIMVARHAADIRRAKEEGKVAAILAVENSNALEQSPHVLRLLWQIGVRSMTITHSTRTWAADGCEVVGGGGLTGFGRDLVAEMDELGMVIDVSHLNDAGFWDTVESSSSPLIASHSCCRQLCDHPRNLSDDQLRALGERGGVAAMTFVPAFIDADTPTVERLLDHIEHAVDVAGIGGVGLGSDFDGGGDLLDDASRYPEITIGLARRGYGVEELAKILGLNHLKVLEAVIG
jgi:membrane dipeptidase